MMMARGIRGATTATENTQDAIHSATAELLRDMLQKNDIDSGDVAAAFFTTTKDLTAAFPSTAARVGLLWDNAALLDSHHMDVPGVGPEKCIRILLLVNTEKTQAEIKFSYLRGAEGLQGRVPGAR